MSEVDIAVLGRFEVVVDSTPVSPSSWTRRNAAMLVKLLALVPERRLHREQVMDAIWPDDAPSVAAPKLHTAAHFARRAMHRTDAVVLRGDTVALFPAHHHLAVAERSAKLWSGTAWEAGLVEARAHVAIAELDAVTGGLLLANAAEQFDLAGHALDAERCRRGVELASPNS